MSDSSQTALADLLGRTKSAHHEHQANDLGGKYSKDWPQWYAHFLIENGIADFLSGKPNQGRLASFMEQSFAAFEAAGSIGDWANFVAGEILAHADLISTPPTPSMEPATEKAAKSPEEAPGDEAAA